MESNIPQFRVGTSWTSVKITTDVDVVLTFRGYAPVLKVEDLTTGLDYIWYISAKSISELLEFHRVENGGRFEGIKIKICRESDDKFAKYLIEPFETNGT